MKTDLSVVSWSDSEALISESRPIYDQGMRVREHFWINQSGLINHESFFPEILQFVRLLIKTIFFSTAISSSTCISNMFSMERILKSIFY